MARGAISRLFVEIGGDTSKLNASLREAVSTAERAGVKITSAGRSIVAGFDAAMNPTKRLGEEIKLLTTAGKSSADIWKVYEGQIRQAVDAQKAMGTAIDPTVKRLMEQHQAVTTNTSALQRFKDSIKSMSGAQSLLAGLGIGTGIYGIVQGIRSTVGAMVDFESSFAGVRKTVNATEQEFDRLEKQFRDLAKQIPVSVNEINRIGEAAGQLGIETKNITNFVRTMADLSVATNMTSDEAATALARLANITQMPQQEFDRLGSVIVELGNNFATTEREIVEMGLRIAGTGKQIGLTEGEILAFATALSSVGVEAEAGGSAISKVFIEIAKQVETSGKNLATFARVAGMSTTEFAKAFQSNAAVAVNEFIRGLGKIKDEGGSALAALEALGITEVRMRNALLAASGAGDLLARALALQGDAWRDNTALAEEAGKRYHTIESQWQMFKNTIADFAITLGDIVLPPLRIALDLATKLTKALSELTSEFLGFLGSIPDRLHIPGLEEITAQVEKLKGLLPLQLSVEEMKAAGDMLPGGIEAAVMELQKLESEVKKLGFEVSREGKNLSSYVLELENLRKAAGTTIDTSFLEGPRFQASETKKAIEELDAATRKLISRGWKLYLDGVAKRQEEAYRSLKSYNGELRRMGELLEEEWRRDLRRRQQRERDQAPISTIGVEIPGIEDIQKAFEDLRREQERAASQMERDARRSIEGVFDAMVSRGKGAFTDLGDWVEGVFLTKLKRLFSDLVMSISTDFKGGLSGAIKGLTSGGIGGVIGGLSGFIPGVGYLAATSGNPYLKGLGIGALGVTGMVGTATLMAGGGAGMFGSLMSSAFTNPYTALGLGGILGGIALAKAIRGKSSQQAGSMEVLRDLGIGYGEDQFKAFYESLGLTESSSYGIRKDLYMSPRFLVEQAFPIAEATGKMKDFLRSLEAVGTSWGTFNFREAFELGRVTGDWSELNKQFKEAWKSTRLFKELPDWQEALMAPGVEKFDKLTQSLFDLKTALEQSIMPARTIYTEFLQTGEIAEEFARQIERAGGSLEEFQRFTRLNLEITGLQETIAFIGSLESSLRSLAPALDPIQQILSGALGPEAVEALKKAGLDPGRFEGLGDLIKIRQAFESFEPFQALTPELREALTRYGGEAGKRAIEQYAQGVNTITADLLASTRTAMEGVFLGSLKETFGYLENAQQQSADKMEELINAVDESKESIVDVLNRILAAMVSGSAQGGAVGATGGGYADPSDYQAYAEEFARWAAEAEQRRALGRWGGYDEWVRNNPPPQPPSLQHGGEVLKTGWAVVHEGEQYSGVGKKLSDVHYHFRIDTVYGFDDFVEKVRQAGIVLQSSADPAWA